jgi:hypothetical protein
MLLGQCIQSTALKQVGHKAMACRETRERTPDAWLVKKSSELATMPDAYKINGANLGKSAEPAPPEEQHNSKDTEAECVRTSSEAVFSAID